MISIRNLVIRDKLYLTKTINVFKIYIYTEILVYTQANSSFHFEKFGAKSEKSLILRTTFLVVF